MDMTVIVNAGISIVTVVGSIVGIKTGMRQIRQEESNRLVKVALMDNHIGEIQNSLTHAHDKIRELYSKNNETSVCIAELKMSMQENTRVLRQVESALTVLSKIEERLNGHIEAGREG